jgi:hypothetical protein
VFAISQRLWDGSFQMIYAEIQFGIGPESDLINKSRNCNEDLYFKNSGNSLRLHEHHQSHFKFRKDEDAS